MRKVKKINGYLVVRFNEREKQGYPQLGSFGVIDAEMYTGCIDTDLGAMEYEKFLQKLEAEDRSDYSIGELADEVILPVWKL